MNIVCWILIVYYVLSSVLYGSITFTRDKIIDKLIDGTSSLIYMFTAYFIYQFLCR